MGRGKLGVYFFLFLLFHFPSISSFRFIFSIFSYFLYSVFSRLLLCLNFGVNSGVIHRLGIIISWDFGH